MSTISMTSRVVTTINTFTVEPRDQQQALGLLIESPRQLPAVVAGFLAANFHKSIDGTRVVNDAQSSSQEAVEEVTASILKDLENPLLAELRAIASPEMQTSEVCAIGGSPSNCIGRVRSSTMSACCGSCAKRACCAHGLRNELFS